MSEIHTTTQKLRYCDTDGQGHVSNITFAVMCEAGGCELGAAAHMFGKPDFAMVIAHLDIDYLAEMNWPGDVTIETQVSHIGARSFTLCHKLFVGGVQTARARSVMVMIDALTRHSVVLKPEWRQALSRWLNEDGWQAAAE